MPNKKFYVTTPIYYSNSVPHIWHAYSSLIADVIANYKRMNWAEVKFSTWVDENSQKVVEKAEEAKMDIMKYADLMASQHKAVWDWLNISYTDFVRTTSTKHKEFVQEVLQKSFDNWDIYEWVYEWLYCVGCEAFKKPNDLDENGCCPDHLKKPQVIKEKNYFFRLSKYQKDIENLFEKNKEFIIPFNRFAEMKEFVKWWLEDFSVSRETNKFGIPLPFDKSQVTYVWYDALLNYITVCQGWDEEFWPANLHIVGKDILRFHAIYWPAMLISAWYKLPEQILATWFFTIDWQKISKSLWNVIDPVEFSTKYSRDLMLLYLLSAFPIWQDWDFSEEQAVTMYNAKLANNLGNLLNRVIVLGLKIWGKLSTKKEYIFEWLKETYKSTSKWEWKLTEIEWNPLRGKPYLIEDFLWYFNKYDLKSSLDVIFFFCDTINLYTTKTEPWKMISEWKNEEAEEVLYIIAEWLRVIWILLYPFFTEKMSEMLVRLWLEDYPRLLDEWKIEELLSRKETFTIKEKWEALYPRI